RVPRLHIDVLAGNDGVTLREPLRRQDVGELAVLVFEQRDEAGSVRVVLDTLHLRRHVELAPLEVDDAISLLVAAATEAAGDATVVVASAGRILALGQGFDRLAAVEPGAVDEHKLALARRDRVVGLECHRALLTGPWSRRSCDPLRASRSRAWSAT